MAVAQRPDPDYVFEQSAVDHSRLELVSNWSDQLTLEACQRAGLKAGARVIDVGCGPIGALPVLAQLVGPSGTVVGIDSSSTAISAARARLSSLGLAAVHTVEADINTVEPETLLRWGPFDLAVCRLLLVHQRDPVATLRAVMRLMRPEGRILAVEPLRDPGFPRYDPPVPAVKRIIELDIAHLRHRGLPYDIAWEYGAVFRAAGLTLLEWRGHLFMFTDSTAFLESLRLLLPSQQSGLIAAGLTTETEIQQLTAEVDAAIASGFRRSTTLLVGDAIGAVPA
jgi:SAM-dependent methyltransferase